jgi:geranylgeranyl diphosphate synthase, type I
MNLSWMNAKHRLPGAFTVYHDAIRLELKEVIDTSPSALRNMLLYHMVWRDQHGRPYQGGPGKLVRPDLCLFSCVAVGGDASQVIPTAAAIELIHNFSLIHDDIEDASNERHHRPAVWKLWGQPQAINAGDAMFSLAFIAMLRLREKRIADEKITTATEMLSSACLELCEGQYLDLDYENRLDVTIDDYLLMAGKKTAALFAASASLGAYLGTEDGRSVDILRQFGRGLGMAFQIRDDIDGIWGSSAVTGKPAGDIPQRKKTLPVVYGLQNSRGRQRQRLEKLYSQESVGDDIAEVTEILERLGAREHAESTARQYGCEALEQLEAAGLDSSRAAPLEHIASFLSGGQSEEG